MAVLMTGDDDPMMAIFVALVVAVLSVVALSYLSWRWSSRRLPPSPARLPVIGHLHLLRPPVHRTFQELAGRLGPLMHIRLGSTHCVVASTADVASELIRSHEGAISERPSTVVARQFAYDSAGFAFAPYNTHWRFMKRLCMSELLGPRTVEQLRPVRRAGTVSLIVKLLAAAAASSSSSLSEKGEGVVDLTRELIRLSNTSIIRMVASTVPGSVTDEAQELVKEVAELVGAFNVADYIAVCRGWDLQGLGKRAADVHRRFDALLEELIRHKEQAREAILLASKPDDDKQQAREAIPLASKPDDDKQQAREAILVVASKPDDKQQPRDAILLASKPDDKQQPAATRTTTNNKDLLDILLDKAADQAAEVKLTRDNIKAFVIDVVTAGSDTSAAMVEWMLVELLNHPEALHKVQEEIDAVVGRDRIVNEADLPRLPYLQAAYKETLRLHPAAPIAHRQSTEEMVIRGFTVPPQTAVFINLWAIGRDPTFWEDPKAFRPERFMPGGAAEGLEPRGQHFQFMPFGSGRRGCPGMGLALQSVPAVLATLVQCFHWDHKAAIDMEESDGLVCARKNPLLLRPTARLNPFPTVV